MRLLNLFSEFIGKTFAIWTLLFALLGFLFRHCLIPWLG